MPPSDAGLSPALVETVLFCVNYAMEALKTHFCIRLFSSWVGPRFLDIKFSICIK